MEVFHNTGSPGVLVIGFDETDPLHLKFNHSIILKVILGPDLSAPHQFSLDTSDLINALRAKTIVNSSACKDGFESLKGQLNASLSSNFCDKGNEESTAKLEVKQTDSKPLNDVVNDTAEMGINSSFQQKHAMSRSGSLSQDKEDVDNDCEVVFMNSSMETEQNSGGPQTSATDNHRAHPKKDEKRQANGLFCEVCKKSFKDKLAFSRHQMVVISKVKCVKCGKLCQSKAHLLLHDHYAHKCNQNEKKVNPLKCPICQNSCKESDVFSHVRANHTNEGLYQCCKCHSNFQNYSHLQFHLKTHYPARFEGSKVRKRTPQTLREELDKKLPTGGQMRKSKVWIKQPNIDHEQYWTRTWKCEFCERVFKTNGEYLNHLRSSEIVEMCEECHFGGPSKASIMIHQYQRHIKGTEKDPWKTMEYGKVYCHVCGEICLLPNLLDHIMINHTGEVPYQCCICKAPSQTHDAFLDHGKIHQQVPENNLGLITELAVRLSAQNENNFNKLTCKLCRENFDCETDFIHHHKNVTDQKICDICQMPSFTKAGSIVHNYITHGWSLREGSEVLSLSSNGVLWREDSPHNEDGPIRCPCCPDNIPVKDLLYHVMESHTFESPFKCCSCNEFSSSLKKFFDHCDFHLGKMPYGSGMCVCHPCNLRFESRDLLLSHQKLHKNVCGYCLAEFSTKYLLNIHLHNDHSKDMMSCELCGKKFPTLSQFAEHKRHHYYRKQYQCPICGVMVCKLEEHMLHHNSSTEKTFSCHVCGAQRSNLPNLKRHMRIHNNEKPNVCDLCKKTFNTKDLLAAHARTHLNQRKMFECQVCGKKCSQRYNLRIHMRTHKSEKAFKCDICQQGFNYNQSLQAHIKSKHGIPEAQVNSAPVEPPSYYMPPGSSMFYPSYTY